MEAIKGLSGMTGNTSATLFHDQLQFGMGALQNDLAHVLEVNCDPIPDNGLNLPNTPIRLIHQTHNRANLQTIPQKLLPQTPCVGRLSIW